VISGCYKYKALEDLPAVRNNLAKLAETFENPLIGGVDSAAIRLVNQPNSPADLLDAIYEAAAECADTFIFYYAGHGLTAFQSGDLSLALPGSDIARPHTSVRFDDVRHAVLSARKAPRKIVLLDCCFSGRAMAGTMGDAGNFAARSDIEGTYILTAAAETKTALAPPGEAYTAFTGELLRILNEGIPGAPEYLNLDNIYEILHSRLASKSRPIPQQRNRNAGSKILLARNLGYRHASMASEQMDQVFRYVHDRMNEGIDPEALRSKMNSLHLPYSERIDSARALAHYDTKLVAECCRAIDDMLSAPDIGDGDSVKAMEVIARLDASRIQWAHRKLSEIAAKPVGSSKYTPIIREHASDALNRIGLRDAAIGGYRAILDDSNVYLRRRAMAAASMARIFPECREIAVAFMWRVAKSEKVAIRDRLDTLREICVIDPEEVPAASTVIAKINGTRSAKASE
jgi:hypothetical protein